MGGKICNFHPLGKQIFQSWPVNMTDSISVLRSLASEEIENHELWLGMNTVERARIVFRGTGREPGR